MEEIQNALDLKIELDQLRPIDKEQENRIMQKFRLDWNYHSNHLEGNSLTYGETKLLLMEELTSQSKPLKDSIEMTNHNEAINWVIEMIDDERPITENFIRELHLLLLVKPYMVDALTPDGKATKKKILVGSYKKTPNQVKTKSGEIFYYATPEETPAEMFDLLKWYNENSQEKNLNPISLAASFHYKFIRIHPFDDGNGRIVRLLMNFILMKNGFPPVIIKSDRSSKDEYFAALQMADAGNIESFISYIATNLNHSLEIMIAGAKGENIEENDDLDKEIALLEQRLSGFGEKIEKVRTLENINDIFSNTIKKLAFEIRDKLARFEKHYLKHEIYIGYRGESYILSQAVFSLDEGNYTNEISLYIDYNSIRREGLENYAFRFGIKFKFNELNYHVYETKVSESFYTKNYINLSDKERHNVLSKIIKEHNESLENVLNKK